MRNPEKHEKNKTEVFNLITKDFQTTKAIKEKGIKAGLFSNWTSYNKYLNNLFEENKLEKVKTTAGILWKKK